MRGSITFATWFLACCLAVLPHAALAGYDWQAPIKIRGEDNGQTYYGGGNFVQRADGKMLITYQINTWVMLSVVDTEQELLTVSNASAKKEWQFYNLHSPNYKYCDARLQRLSNGHILLYVLEYGNDQGQAPAQKLQVKVYESKSGLGTDFQLKSVMLKADVSQDFVFGARSIGQAIEVKGKILVPLTIPVIVGSGPPSVASSILYCAVSTDKGRTWSFDQISTDSWWRDPTRGFGVAGNLIIVLGQDYYAGGITTFYSKPLTEIVGTPAPVQNGTPTWYQGDVFARKAIGDMLGSHFFLQPDGFTYFLDHNDDTAYYTNYAIYRRPSRKEIDGSGQTPFMVALRGSGATWIGPMNPTQPVGDDLSQVFSLTPSGHLAVYGPSVYGGISLIVGFKNNR